MQWVSEESDDVDSLDAVGKPHTTVESNQEGSHNCSRELLRVSTRSEGEVAND